MPWIENCAADDMHKAWHHDPGPNSMLIQIMDTGTSWWPKPRHTFKETHKFEFLDVEESDFVLEPQMKISDEQAIELVRLLKHALDNRMNVVVHCFAGICRSGAVVEVGTMLGFDAVEKFRSPNLLVKHKMMKVLGLTYDENEKHTVNGRSVTFSERAVELWEHEKDKKYDFR